MGDREKPRACVDEKHKEYADRAKEGFERLIPDLFTRELALERMVLDQHRDRYHFAANTLGHDRPLRVLDLACDSGYGSRILKDHLHPESQVTGVDIDSDAIDYAKKRYQIEGMHYLAEDGMAFLSPKSLDAIVSFDTIGHVAEPQRLISGFASQLSPQGTMIACVPIGFTTDLDRFHYHDFSERKFRRMISEAGFVIEKDFWQTVHLTLKMMVDFKKNASPEHYKMFTRAMRGTARGPSYFLAHPHKLFWRLWILITRQDLRNLTVVARKPA